MKTLSRLPALSAAALAAALCGCASAPAAPPTPSLPAWVLNPNADYPLAGSYCAPVTGNVSRDRQLAVGQARAELAKQISVRVAAMDELVSGATVSGTGGTETHRTFTSVSRQLTDRTLAGTRAVETGVYPINGKDNLCVLVAMDPAGTEGLFGGLLDAAGLPVDQQQRDELRRTFTAPGR